MSKKQYEDFLVELFFDCAKNKLSIGEKLHFKSPDDKNSLKLFNAFCRKSESSFSLDNEEIKYFLINGFRVIPVLHSDDAPGYTENYISYLRDHVSSQMGNFKNSILLIIHNSSLDTLNNSSKDLTLAGNIWNTKAIYVALLGFINESSFKDHEISKHLLNHQFELICADGATMFGFEELFNAVQDGNIEFNELGYLNDSALESWSECNINQIEKRLNENKRLKEDIEYIIEQFPTEYVEKLIDFDFSEKFIEKFFSNDDLESWKKALDFGECQQEREKNSVDLIEFSELNTNEVKKYHRTKGVASQKSSSASRDHHLIIEVSPNQKLISFEVVFVKGQLSEDEIKTSNKFKKLFNFRVNNRSNKKTVISLETEFDGTPKYLNFEIKRAKPKECFKFRVLLIPENIFPVSSFEDKFLIVPNKELIILETDQSELTFDSSISATYTLSECGESIDINEFGAVDFDKLLNTEEQVNFILKRNEYTLTFEIQGILSVSSLNLPLIFNSGSYQDFFDDQVFGIYNAKNSRISFSGREYRTKNEYKKLLELEIELVSQKVLSTNTIRGAEILIDDLAIAYPALSTAYTQLYDYLKDKNTTLSLVSWGKEFRSLVNRVVTEYVELIHAIPTERMLSYESKTLVNLGFCELDDVEYIAPFHPLNLSYFLNLINECLNDSTGSFKTLHGTTLRRLSAEGLIPFNWHVEHDFSYSHAVSEHPMWIQVIPQKQTQLNYIRPLVRQKTTEFVEAFKILFNQGERDTLLINSIHNGHNQELFLGLVGFVQKLKPQDVPNIHVNLYDDELTTTYFDVVADAVSQRQLKQLCKLSLLDNSVDQIADLIHRRITYSKFEINEEANFEYAHLTFIRNNTPVEVANVDLKAEKTGIACNGLLAGETSYNQQSTYFTTAGLKGIQCDKPVLQIVQRYSALSHAAWKNQNFYESNGLALKVSNKLQQLLDRAYEDSLWTVIIDPKVTLDFFKTQQDVVLIHYSDNYTNSAHYDAITVTKRRDLYDQILSQGQAGRIDEFNAFNGEWLLKMLTLPEKDRREKKSIIAAYKYINSLLYKSDITWVPLSVAEMIRVSGNIGLKMSESDFSTYCQGKKYGVISDDVVFVGFKDQQMYLLPLEVKVGQKQRHDKGILQAKKLKRYLETRLFGRQDLVGYIYRGLFIRQIMMQVEKYQLYQTYPENYFDRLLQNREWWLGGDYQIADIQNYPKGFVLAFVESDTFFQEKFGLEKDILVIKLPGACQNRFISTPLKVLLEETDSKHLFNIPDLYILNGDTTYSQIDLSDSSEIDDEQHVVFEDLDQGSTLKEEHQQNLFDSSTEVEQPEATENIRMPIPQISIYDGPLRVHFGENAITHEQLYWEPTNTAKFMNTNTGIIGTMGTGKTQFTKSLITQLMQNQDFNVNSAQIGMLIFDYKSDYVDDEFVEINSVKRHKLYKLPYNPLSLFGDTPMLPVHTARGFSDTMAKAFGLGVKQQAMLRKIVLDAYEQAGIDKVDVSTWHLPAPTIKDIWNLFEATEPSIDSLYAALESLNELEIFESDNNQCSSLYDLLDGVLVVELAGYPPQVQNLVVALTLDLFYSQMQKKGKPQVQGDYRQITKMILVDEADNFMSQDFPSLRKVLKEGREYGVGMVLSTQDITHFKTGENNYSAYILTWVIHRVAQISNGDIKAIFNVDDKSEQENLMETIRKLDKHYSLYIDGQKKLVKMKDKAFWELCQQLQVS
jgi:DNA phosphorothioation-dependent restriction protein DptH